MENAYKGKFLDRCPGFRAAGILTQIPGNTVEGCLKIPEQNLTFFIEKDKDSACDAEYQTEQTVSKKKETRAWPPTQLTEMFHLLKMDDKSPYQHLANELSESVYSSHWRSPLGRRIHLPVVPSCFNPEQLTHGDSTESKIPASVLINPSKSLCQVLKESEIGKALYKISHDDYDPGEQIQRNYGGKFDPCVRFGMNTPHFNDGRKMRRVLKWIIEDPVSYVSVRQADFTDRHKSHLGKSQSVPYCPRITAPEHSKFGICVKAKPNVNELLGGDSSCSDKQDQLMYIKYINTIRMSLKKRHFSYMDLMSTFRKLDEKCCGKLHIATIDTVCRQKQIYINKPIIKLMEILGILDESQCVNIYKFVDLINWQCSFPIIPKVDESHDREFDYTTTYSSSLTGEKADTSGLRPAGRPSAPQDVMFPRSRREVKADMGNLEGETDAYALLNPSIFSAYGLTHRDFFKPCSSQELEKIFTAIGVTLPADVFNELWEEGCCLDQTGGVCIETFRNLLQKLATMNMLNT